VAPSVVQVAPDAPVHLDRDDALPAGPADPERLGELQETWGLGGPVDRLIAALEAARN